MRDFDGSAGVLFAAATDKYCFSVLIILSSCNCICPSQEFENIEGVLLSIALEFHFQPEIRVSMQPSSLVNIFWSDSDEPVLAMAQI